MAAAVQRHGAQLDVILLADRRTAYRYVQPVMLACSQEGQRDVKLAVRAPPGGGR
jgi:biopolymer transport protein ExbD